MSAVCPYRCTGTTAVTGLPQPAVDQLRRCAGPRSTALPGTPRSFSRIHVVGALVDVDEIGPRAGLGDRLGGRDERIRDRDDDVALR